MELTTGTKLFASDKGFGEKHGVIIEVIGQVEHRVKWDEFEQPMWYSPGELPWIIANGNIAVVA